MLGPPVERRISTRPTPGRLFREPCTGGGHPRKGKSVAVSLESMEAKAYPVGLAGASVAVADFARAIPPVKLRVVGGTATIGAGLEAWRPRGLVAATRFELAIKRTMDLVLALAATILLLPLLLVTALLVAATSRGSVFYVQQRIGRGGRPFRIYKFRSMFSNAHEIKERYTVLNEASGPVFKCRQDPRITPIGRLIRKLSIDELPQLINVLRGEMSLVGPRPPLPEEFGAYGPRELQRMSVTPGMTGIWQISGRSNLDFDTWVDLDIRYIDTWSLWQDLKLLVQTVPAVISARGAY
jgi:lipopolysaccharide/colanic/teichoic acid biosynthesis glycosyltransferase